MEMDVVVSGCLLPTIWPVECELLPAFTKVFSLFQWKLMFKQKVTQCQ